jgi:hypothetical protein
MVGRSLDKKMKYGITPKLASLKQLMNELSTAYGSFCVSYDTVRRWKKKFESGVESKCTKIR